MAQWHLEDLYDALAAKGWSIIEHPGDDYRVSGVWEVQRSMRQPPLFIDFHGQDDMRCLPMNEAYGCHVRNRLSLSLYFGRKGPFWKEKLRAFADALDHNDAQLLAKLMSDISERCYAAGWMLGTEKVLWRAIQEGPVRWGQDDITAEDIEMLQALSKAAGGWIKWDDVKETTFIPIDDWVKSKTSAERECAVAGGGVGQG